MEGIKIVGEWDFIYGDGRKITYKNQITQNGLNLLGMLFVNETTNDIPFYLGMGTGTTAASISDTQLQAESFRKILASKSRSNSMVRLRFFLQSQDAIGNWQEYGIYMAGTQLLGSGTLFNRLVKPISKTASEVLTVEVRITFSA